MLQELQTLSDQAQADITAATDTAALEMVRIKYFGRQGSLAQMGEGMKTVSKDERPAVGKKLNEVRQQLTALLEERSGQFTSQRESAALSGIDLSLPGTLPLPAGGLHPLTQLLDRTVQIFRRMGFASGGRPGR